MTGYDHPKCFMRGDQTCSKKLTGEHYISQSVLQRLGPVIAVSGMHWQPKGQVDHLPILALTANVLCDSHNSSMSYLDSYAGTAFDVVEAAVRQAVSGPPRDRPKARRLNGEHLQLWGIKCFIGALTGGVLAKDRMPLAAFTRPDISAGIAALRGSPLPPFLGLYIASEPDAKHEGILAMTPLTETRSKAIVGMRWCFYNMHFDIILSHARSPRDRVLWRPNSLTLKGPGSTSVINVEWAPKTPYGSDVFLEVAKQLK